MNTDVMIDTETLATGTGPAILTVGCVRFDPLGNEVDNPQMTTLYFRVDYDSCLAHGLEVSESTVEWWGRQSPEAQEEALGDGTPDNPRLTLEEGFDRLYKFVWGADRVWSNGATADIVWCETVFGRIGRAIPWKFWQVRDVRTAFDLGINPHMPQKTEHHALADAINQAIGIQRVYRNLRGAVMGNGADIQPFTDWRKRD